MRRVTGPVERGPLRFAYLYQLASRFARAPVKMSFVDPQLVTGFLQDRHYGSTPGQPNLQLVMDLVTIYNQELRELAAAGCPIYQSDLPPFAQLGMMGASGTVWDLAIKAFNAMVEGIDGMDIWMHYCWGRPYGQFARGQAGDFRPMFPRVFDANFHVLNIECGDCLGPEMELLDQVPADRWDNARTSRSRPSPATKESPTACSVTVKADSSPGAHHIHHPQRGPPCAYRSVGCGRTAPQRGRRNRGEHALLVIQLGEPSLARPDPIGPQALLDVVRDLATRASSASPRSLVGAREAHEYVAVRRVGQVPQRLRPQRHRDTPVCAVLLEHHHAPRALHISHHRTLLPRVLGEPSRESSSRARHTPSHTATHTSGHTTAMRTCSQASGP
jgi:hypothetical protein